MSEANLQNRGSAISNKIKNFGEIGKILKRHKFLIAERQVLKTAESPDLIDKSRLPLLITQREIGRNHVLRVVYKEEFGNIKIITFYPARKKQYDPSINSGSW